MPDAANGAGQGAPPPEPLTPGAPGAPPADAGQGDAGQGDGQGGQHHELNPDVTRAQQAAADARAEVAALRAELDAAQGAAQPVDQERAASQKAFDDYASSSPVVQGQIARARNQQAMLMDTQMVTDKGAFPHYDAVRPKVLADLKTMGDIPVERAHEAMQMVYARHASPIVNARDSALMTENETLKARITALEGGARAAGVDVGALQTQGGQGAAAPTEIPEPAADASAADWAEYIDARNAQRGM